MKNTETLTFAKTISTSTASTEAIVTIEHGTDKRGGLLQIVNQVNTANVVIDNARDEFEDGKTSLNEMIKLIESQGFVRK